MRMILLVLVTSGALLALSPARAADLFAPVVPPPPQPRTVIERVDGLCTMRPGNIVRRMPEGRIERSLPVGFFVIVIDYPFSAFTDLWVRIRALNDEIYYGWVRPHDLSCH